MHALKMPTARTWRQRLWRVPIGSTAPRPWARFALGVVAAIVLLGLAGILVMLRGRAATLQGPLLQGSFLQSAAPNFTLTDQNGQPVQLADQRGKVVAITFLYTSCPDLCPLITEKLAAADRQLGGDSAKLVLLAVTVDPAHDTPQAVQQFDVAHNLTQQPNWHYLLGTLSQLKPVWTSYYIGTDAAEAEDSPAAASSAPSPDQVEHTALVYLVDPQQRLRAALDANFTVADFVHDVRAIAQ